MKYESVVVIQPRLKPFKGLPSLVPFLCLFFILLLFFMVGSNSIPIPGISVELPTANIQTKFASRGLVVTIDKDSQYYINDVRTSDIGELKRRLVELLGNRYGKKELEKERMIIRMDKNADNHVLLQLLAVAEEMNLNSLLMTAPEGVQKTNFAEIERR